jgi:hypothetical protein
MDAPSCSAGSSCSVRVEVLLRPAPVTRPISWTLTSFDPCTGATAKLASNIVVAQPGWTDVIGFSNVALPRGENQTLVAVTDTPSRAASSVVQVTGQRFHCHEGGPA